MKRRTKRKVKKTEKAKKTEKRKPNKETNRKKFWVVTREFLDSSNIFIRFSIRSRVDIILGPLSDE